MLSVYQNILYKYYKRSFSIKPVCFRSINQKWLIELFGACRVAYRNLESDYVIQSEDLNHTPIIKSVIYKQAKSVDMQLGILILMLDKVVEKYSNAHNINSRNH